MTCMCSVAERITQSIGSSVCTTTVQCSACSFMEMKASISLESFSASYVAIAAAEIQ